MKHKPILLLGAVAVALTLSTPAFATCKASYYHGANSAFLTGHRKTLAQENAISSWAVRVLGSIGPDWTNWSNAKNKSFRCVKTLAKKWRCTAKARPCNK